jgi:transcriptional regulator of acetoin/glycerol metabolism
MVDKNLKNTLLSDIVGTLKTTENNTSQKYLSLKIKPLADVERNTILEAISLCEGNIPKAAVFLDVAPSTLYRKIRQWEKKTCKNKKD